MNRNLLCSKQLVIFTLHFELKYSISHMQCVQFSNSSLLSLQKRYVHILPYHSSQEHDALGEEFLDYQTMPLPRLEADPDIEGFWANMASLKHKVRNLILSSLKTHVQRLSEFIKGVTKPCCPYFTGDRGGQV